MSLIRAIAAAAAAAALVFALSPASARGCGDDKALCIDVGQKAPVKLDQFMQTWQPAEASKRVSRSKTARYHRRSVKEAAAKHRVAEPAPARESAAAESAPARAEQPKGKVTLAG